LNEGDESVIGGSCVMARACRVNNKNPYDFSIIAAARRPHSQAMDHSADTARSSGFMPPQ
jgi:hypothetical protein